MGITVVRGGKSLGVSQLKRRQLVRRGHGPEQHLLLLPFLGGGKYGNLRGSRFRQEPECELTGEERSSEGGEESG